MLHDGPELNRCPVQSPAVRVIEIKGVLANLDHGASQDIVHSIYSFRQCEETKKSRTSILRQINMILQIKCKGSQRKMILPSGFCPLLIFWTKSSRSVRRPPMVWTDLIKSGYSSLSKWLYTNSSADSNDASVRTMCSKGMLGNAKDGVK